MKALESLALSPSRKPDVIRSTGIGSLPGTDIREAMTTVTGEFPDLVWLPELPARGVGADMIGRTASLLAEVSEDFAVAPTPTGWRFADRPGAAMRRANAFLREDLDTLEEFCHMATSDVKVQIAGPVTLAATIELMRGERAVRDAGALRDLVTAHRDAVLRHVIEVRRRLPKAQLIVQVDEPAMDAALRGLIPSQSGFTRLRALEEPLVRSWHAELAEALRNAGTLPWMHSCSPNWHFALAANAGYAALSGDFSLVRDADDDDLGTAIERGVTIIAGVIPVQSVAPRTEAPTVSPIRARFQRLGFNDQVLAKSVVVSTTCGLGQATWPEARIAMARTRAAAHVLADQLVDVSA